MIREGVHALTVRRIATEADVNSALIRYHFGGTAGLLEELALRNAACISDARAMLLDALPPSNSTPQDFNAIIDALVLPLWTSAAMTSGHRAIIVLDEIFSRSMPELHDKIWQVFVKGVARVSMELERCQPETDPQQLAWRIRFVTAAALDLPPRTDKPGATPARALYEKDDKEERLKQFRSFARHALRPAQLHPALTEGL